MSNLNFQSLVSRSSVAALNGPQSAAVSPDNAHVYIAAYVADAIVALSRGANGELSHVQTLQGTASGGSIPDFEDPRAVKISADGSYAYVVASDTDSISVFQRNAATGELALVQSVTDGANGVTGLNGPRQCCLTDDGNWLFAVASYSDAVLIFSRDGATGKLNFFREINDGSTDQPYDICMSPDQRNAYVASSRNDSLQVFEWDGAGNLTLIQKNKNGLNGISNIDQPRAIAISPDGTSLYCAARGSDAITHWRRDLSTGMLSFINAYVDTGKGGAINNLNSPQNVMVSNDGATVWATAYLSDAVSCFARDASGNLIQTQTVTDGSGSGELNGARGLAQSPDSQYVYVCALTDDDLNIYEVA